MYNLNQRYFFVYELEPKVVEIIIHNLWLWTSWEYIEYLQAVSLVEGRYFDVIILFSSFISAQSVIIGL